MQTLQLEGELGAEQLVEQPRVLAVVLQLFQLREVLKLLVVLLVEIQVLTVLLGL
ncbi:hypothetical protein D3C71_1716780 [compost metagenome]